MPSPSFREHFRAIAGRYQSVRSLDQRAVRKIAKRLARAPAAHGLRLLDVGTGTGRYLRAMTDVRAALGRQGAFRRIRLRNVAWWQLISLPTLVRQARARHYSTFRFYEPAEFERALATFRERLRAIYDYPWAIPVRNSHLIAVARRRA